MGSDHIENWKLLCEYVSRQVEKKKVPGVALGILSKGEMFCEGFGVTNVDHPLPVTDETLFQIGSITKTFTGTVMMRLVEAGKVDLDATVRTYLPDFKVADEEVSAKVTVRQLLTHVGGWVGDFFHDTGPGDEALAKYVEEMADLEQLAPLGTVWSYNNSGFGVAALIIEKVTGQSYEQVLKEFLLDPLGMENAFLFPGDIMTYRFAVGHNVMDESAQVARPWPLPRAVHAVGGITCHVKDLLKYARFHLGNGTVPAGDRLLESASMQKMQTPQVTLWKQEAWGLSWAVNDSHGARIVSHGGGTTGQISQLSLVPEHDFAIAIFTNSNSGGELTQPVVNKALKMYLDIEIPEPAPIESSEETLAAYVGVYSRPFMDVELGILGGKLIAQVNIKKGFPTQDSPPPPPPVSLALSEEDRLLVLDGPFKDARADVIRKPDGSIGWLRMGRIHARQ